MSAAASSTISSSTMSILVRATRAEGDVQEFDDAQVLARLGHDAVVGGHHQQEEVDAGGARHHVLDEALVAGDVDHREVQPAGQGQLGVAQLDRDAPLLLLAQTVGVLAGQGTDQRGLAVVDVTGRAERESTVHRRTSRAGREARVRDRRPSRDISAGFLLVVWVDSGGGPCKGQRRRSHRVPQLPLAECGRCASRRSMMTWILIDPRRTSRCWATLGSTTQCRETNCSLCSSVTSRHRELSQRAPRRPRPTTPRRRLPSVGATGSAPGRPPPSAPRPG